MNQPSVTLIRRQLPVYNTADMLVDDQDLNHIISAIKKYHGRHKADYSGIAEEFWTGDPTTTAKQLFNFCKKYVMYKVEPESDQTIKSPGRIISEGYGDCKHYSSFIAGVVDALSRKGHPIEANYRFVSDHPGRDVHHVFAVVRGGGSEYWVDPVLDNFDERPNFHNPKDVFFNNGVGRLTYLAGTEVGKKHHHKSFKELMHNFGKSIEKAGYDAGKGVKKAASDIEHVALKVGMAPARNAFLALVDLNAFNIAQRMNNTLAAGGQKGHDLKQKWRDIGGDEKKLANAIHNGMKHKAFYHHHASPKKVNGLSCGDCIGMGAEFHSRWVTTHPHRWPHEYPAIHHMHRRYGLQDHRDKPRMMGALVGEPVSTASLMALASGIIAALSKFFSKDPQSDAAMADSAKDGVTDIVSQAAAADAAEGDAKADKMQSITTPAAGADAQMAISTGLDEHGQPQVTVHDVSHPALDNAGTPGGGAAADVAAPDDGGDGSNVPATTAPGGGNMLQQVELFAKNNWKKGLIVIGIGIAVVKGPTIIKSLTKKRR